MYKRVAAVCAAIGVLAAMTVAASRISVAASEGPFPVAPKPKIDTLSYFINTTGKALDGGHLLSNLHDGRNVYYTKWTETQFENYAYDDEYIYLREDRSDSQRTYTYSDGRWMKRYMTLGETVVASANRIQHYDVGGGTCVPTQQGVFPYTNTLVAHSPRDLGPEWGVRSVIVLQYDHRVTADSEYERMHYAKGLGWVKWERFVNHTLVQTVSFTRAAQSAPLQPRTSAACENVPVPQRWPALPTTVDGFVTSLYRCVLNEEPDAPGFADYTRRLRDGTLTPQSIYAEFFRNQSGASVERFANTLYGCILFRDPDPSSYDDIVTGLRAGRLTRPALVQSILGSAEFTNRILPVLRGLG